VVERFATNILFLRPSVYQSIKTKKINACKNSWPT